MIENSWQLDWPPMKVGIIYIGISTYRQGVSTYISQKGKKYSLRWQIAL